MIKILVEGIDPIPEGMDPDIERVFDSVRLTGDAVERALLEEIEQGSYLDPHRFISRDGIALSKRCLSTGCKAALCVHHLPTTPLCCIEMGANAVEAVIKYCKEGTIYLINRAYMLCNLDVDIDVSYKGEHFTSLSDFSVYMEDEWIE